MSEADEQAAVVQYCDLQRIPVYHIPSEARRSAALAARMKRQGLKPGVPDLCIPVARGGYHSLYIEMKYGRNKPTQKQLEWIALLRKQGMEAFVCYGACNCCIRLLSEYQSVCHCSKTRCGSSRTRPSLSTSQFVTAPKPIGRASPICASLSTSQFVTAPKRLTRLLAQTPV